MLYLVQLLAVKHFIDAINTVCFSTYGGGPISIDQGLVKAISFSPVLLNKGHTILDPDGPVWVSICRS